MNDYGNNGNLGAATSPGFLSGGTDNAPYGSEYHSTTTSTTVILPVPREYYQYYSTTTSTTVILPVPREYYQYYSNTTSTTVLLPVLR